MVMYDNVVDIGVSSKMDNNSVPHRVLLELIGSNHVRYLAEKFCAEIFTHQADIVHFTHSSLYA